jgi:hypothetical protein
MKELLAYFRRFHQEYYNRKAYGLSLLFIAGLITLNYSIDLEDSIIDPYAGTAWHFFLFFVLHLFAFLGVFFLFQCFGKSIRKPTRNAWIKIMLGFSILALDRSFTGHRDWVMAASSPETFRYLYKIAHNLLPLLTVFLPMLVLLFLFDRHLQDGFYGLRLKHTKLGIYWLMLAGMVPLVFAASWLPDFMEYYPVYRRSGGAAFAEAMQWPGWVVRSIYETAYLMNFIFVEMLFRGLLVIGLSRMLGGNVVMAMAATYAVYHFGKPIGETISSVFGGYILGVIALYTRNIYGGIFLHGGIALLMELFAFMHYS